MGEYYDRYGKEITLEEWAIKHNDWNYKRVKQTDIGDIKISTVWLGLDHGFETNGPLIFETMVFGLPQEEGEPQIRYKTLQGAAQGHDAMVAYYQAKTVSS